ncbi:type II toxin-antitoxin system RelE/ParE family toxin [Pedobacter sp. UYP24]
MILFFGSKDTEKIWNGISVSKLPGDLKDYYSIRINDQWRIIFKWSDGKAT